jgi:hypothetical protein
MTEALFDVDPATSPPPQPVRDWPDTNGLHGLLVARYSQTAPGNGLRWVLARDVRNQAGFGGYRGPMLRTADLIAVDTWESGPVRLVGHEVKCSRADWLRELADPSKAAAFEPFVAEWWLVAADRSIVREGELPAGWGLMAPAGPRLRAVVRAARREQPPLPIGFVAALLRAAVRP